MKTSINEIEFDRNKAAHVILFAEDTSNILVIFPTKALPRPFKNNASKMTKGSDKPWKLPGDKRKLGETMHETAARGLQEKTDLVLADLDATLLASDTVFIAKDAILLYSIPTELPITAGEDVHLAQWMPCQGARLTSIGSFPLTAALKLVAGVQRPLCLLPYCLRESDRSPRSRCRCRSRDSVISGQIANRPISRFW
jgi:ADP-ribose pyrophosphatase YjhB (NUDIX family)